MSQEIVKVCKVHGELVKGQTFTQKDNRGKSGSVYISCKKCLNISRKKYKLRNYKKTLEDARNYKKRHKETLKEKSRIYRKLHPEISLNWFKKKYKSCAVFRKNYILKQNVRTKKKRDELSDSYILKIIRRNSKILDTSDIPKDMIEAKRAHILALRALKRIKYGSRNS